MQHLDEGTIHAWLDGQLPRDEALEVEAHVAECRQCADAVAEARGLIAASSRILTALDSVPREVVPKEPRFRSPEDTARAADAVADAAADAIVPLELVARRPRRRWFNGASLAAAAAIVVGIGTVAVMQQSSRQMTAVAADKVASPTAASAPAADSLSPAAPPPSAAPAPEVRSLGTSRSEVAEPPVASAPGRALVSRDAANDAGLRARSEGVAASKKAEPDRIVTGTSTPVSETAASALKRDKEFAANKPADELAKDTKQLAQSAQQLQAPPAPAPPRESAVQSAAKLDSARLDRSQALADAAREGVGGLRGRVTDANASALAGATVSVDGTTSSVVTNAAGEFVISGLQGGAHRLTVRRIGYQPAKRDVTVTPGQAAETDVVLTATQATLNEVVVAGGQGAVPRAAPGARAKTAAPAPAGDIPPGAPITAEQSGAVGCYDLGITPLSTSRNSGSLKAPRHVALDSEIVPANANGVWYRARDLARTNPLANGLWRPTGPEAIELEFTFGSRTARIRVSGPAGAMMRGSLEEIDRATATGDAASVVAVRRSCEQ